jgi:SAM-dependent methyltransferase
VSFAVRPDAYDRFMGRYSIPLAPVFADFAGVTAPQRALDVGCGPGALTTELVARLGADAVTAVDPSESFVTAARQRHPLVVVQRAGAEQLPFEPHAFDVSVAQLVVHFMADPVRGLAEMRRVTRPGGVVAACVWDHASGGGPLSAFWEAVQRLDPDAPGEGDLAGTREGHLAQLLLSAGVHDVEPALLSVRVEHQTFDEWWEPYTLGVGPAGAYTATLDDAGRERLREECRRALPDAPFTVTAGAWAARGLA